MTASLGKRRAGDGAQHEPGIMRSHCAGTAITRRLMPDESRTRSTSSLIDEALHRRNFAIISHPDAGKTTLTEKLLLFGGAINWRAK